MGIEPAVPSLGIWEQRTSQVVGIPVKKLLSFPVDVHGLACCVAFRTSDVDRRPVGRDGENQLWKR